MARVRRILAIPDAEAIPGSRNIPLLQRGSQNCGCSEGILIPGPSTSHLLGTPQLVLITGHSHWDGKKARQVRLFQL